jgi:hypothetical protein
MTTARRAKIAADLFVGVTVTIIAAGLFWIGQYFWQTTRAEIAGVEISSAATGTRRGEMRDGLPVIHSKDPVIISLRIAELPQSSFRSDEVIVDCGQTEYTVHSSARQLRSSAPNPDIYGLTYDTPYVACQGPGVMFARIELVVRFNPVMALFPLVIESNHVPAYFTR